MFSIHPLTTEDILMEETREKIELFRTYYFVCFRSFEQDPYSPTYLEPLNMYIIVLREGILSVSILPCFLFYGKPTYLPNAHAVPFPSHTSPTKRSSSHQATQRLYQCHIGLDFICFD